MVLTDTQMERTMKKIILMAAIASSPAMAAEYLTEVESEVYPLEGVQAAAILEKAKTCAATFVTNDQSLNMLVDAGSDSGTMTALTKIDYSEALLQRTLRSSMAVMAKDGRFKIKHTKIEFLNDGPYAIGGDWIPVGKWWGAGGKKAEQMLIQRSADMAACIRKKSDPANDAW